MYLYIQINSKKETEKKTATVQEGISSNQKYESKCSYDFVHVLYCFDKMKDDFILS